MVKTFKLPNLGYELTVGKFAKQADGTAWLKHKNTVVLSTAVMSESKDFPGFLPLSVDYREQFSAAGKIPGGYLKREGRSSDKEILTSRLIDRSIRPQFPSYFFNSVQVLTTVYSIDKEALAAPLSLLASSIALTLSRIPFREPVGAVQVGRIDGKWIVDPNKDDYMNSTVKLMVAGTKEGICMVEGGCEQVSETELIDALFLAHDVIKQQVVWQEEIAKELGTIEKDLTYKDGFDWDTWHNYVKTYLTPSRVDSVFKYGADKKTRKDAIVTIKTDFLEQHKDLIDQAKETCADFDQRLDYIFDGLLHDVVGEEIVTRATRVDGRNFKQVRDITTEVGLMPSVHGSSLFQRGETQALVSTTLGSGKDAQKVDDLWEDEPVDMPFMLHYNFPPFSVGEARPLRGPGRREVGHGYLAKSAIKRVLPNKKDFPYTIRVISDILESNGSSSMATVCGTTMALMDAGVPISDMVAGIAMGLLHAPGGKFQAITDITGFEDALGLMDFKVAGTYKGINAIQMDIKYKGGLKREVFEQALEQAKQARLHILDEMSKVMSSPKAELSPLVPRMISLDIDPNKAGGIIGSGGKIIKEIIEKTGTTIDIEGSEVFIFAPPGSNLDQAVLWVKILADQIEQGMILDGIIARTADFGLFVDIAPGKSGLLHISKIARDKQQQLDKHYPIDSDLKVKVLDYDRETGRIRLGLTDKDK
ncbi:MAG: polyribonucleotide nucleotidyltransferase [Epsilonproteobacteria bacterium]|nr:polyribonucleotide nucleotidyltransferase [Campylobacterota bacterium]